MELLEHHCDSNNFFSVFCVLNSSCLVSVIIVQALMPEIAKWFFSSWVSLTVWKMLSCSLWPTLTKNISKSYLCQVIFFSRLSFHPEKKWATCYRWLYFSYEIKLPEDKLPATGKIQKSFLRNCQRFPFIAFVCKMLLNRTLCWNICTIIAHTCY